MNENIMTVGGIMLFVGSRSQRVLNTADQSCYGHSRLALIRMLESKSTWTLRPNWFHEYSPKVQLSRSSSGMISPNAEGERVSIVDTANDEKERRDSAG